MDDEILEPLFTLCSQANRGIHRYTSRDAQPAPMRIQSSSRQVIDLMTTAATFPRSRVKRQSAIRAAANVLDFHSVSDMKLTTLRMQRYPSEFRARFNEPAEEAQEEAEK
jgi:hypothetical protein